MTTPKLPPPSPELLASLSLQDQQQFLALHGELTLAVMAFVTDRANALIMRGVAIHLGSLVLASAMVEAGKFLLDARLAMIDAGGDPDVAGMLLGIKRPFDAPPPQPPAFVTPEQKGRPRKGRRRRR